MDTATDLETNATKNLSRENSLLLKHGPLSDRAVVKIAQTFRSGTNDIDAIDFVELFLEDESQTNLDSLNDVYVLVNFRPVVTNQNWRIDCGVAAYDNTFGLPPFFRPACASKITSIGFGCDRRVSPLPMSTPPNTMQKAITCEIHLRLRSSTRR